MDIISYGVANKAAKEESATRNTTLAVGVKGTFPNAKGRIDAMESGFASVVAKANKLIVNDTINIMKAHAKLNAVAKTMKYKHQNMVFEDFLDASGIDAAKSSGYTLDATNGLVKASGANPFTITTTQELSDTIPEKAILLVEELNMALGAGLVPAMTGSNTPSGIITISSYAAAGYEGHRAFNRISADAWQVYNNYRTGYISYQFPVKTKVNEYSITSVAYMNPKSWTFEGSFDGITWSVLHTVTGAVSFGATAETRQYKFENEVEYLAYKLNVTAIDNTGSDLAINELQFYYKSSTSIVGSYSISRDDGVTWESITPESLFYFTAKSPQDKKLRIKAVLPANVQLLNYGLTWS